MISSLWRIARVVELAHATCAALAKAINKMPKNVKIDKEVPSGKYAIAFPATDQTLCCKFFLTQTS